MLAMLSSIDVASHYFVTQLSYAMCRQRAPWIGGVIPYPAARLRSAHSDVFTQEARERNVFRYTCVHARGGLLQYCEECVRLLQ